MIFRAEGPTGRGRPHLRWLDVVNKDITENGAKDQGG